MRHSVLAHLSVQTIVLLYIISLASCDNSCYGSTSGRNILKQTVYDAATVFHGQVLVKYEEDSIQPKDVSGDNWTTLKRHVVEMEVYCVLKTSAKAPKLPGKIKIVSKCPFKELDKGSTYLVSSRHFSSYSVLTGMNESGTELDRFFSEERTVYNASDSVLSMAVNVCGLQEVRVPETQKYEAKFTCPTVKANRRTCFNPRSSASYAPAGHGQFNTALTIMFALAMTTLLS